MIAIAAPFVAISLTIAAVSGLYLRGTKPANVEASQMQERRALRDVQIDSGAWR